MALAPPRTPLQTDPPVPCGDGINLRILATTDLHAHLMPWDDLANLPAPGRGLAQVASLIDAARCEQPQALLFDNGDFLNGSPLGDYLAETCPKAKPHPMIAAMNHLGYDAATLGNHEFSQGMGHLQNALKSAQFPVVSANLFRRHPSGKRAVLPRFTLLHRRLHDTAGGQHDLTIGVIGFLPPQTMQWEAGHLQGAFETSDILDAARRCLPKLRRAGADIVIALCHSGIGLPSEQPGAENTCLALSRLTGIDALIGGHTHQVYPDPHTKDPANKSMDAPFPDAAPMVMPGFFGSHLGVIDLQLTRGPTGWQVARHQTELRPVARRSADGATLHSLVATDPAIAAIAAPHQTALGLHNDRIIAHSATPLHSYFALIGNSAVQDLLAASQIDHMRSLLAGSAYADLPHLAAVAPFKAGGRGGPENYTDIPAGDLSLRNVFDLYIHPNTAVALCLTGKDIALWLERSASLFRQVAPGARDASLINPAYPGYNFDMIHGLEYQIDLSTPPRFDENGKVEHPEARRIKGLRFDGAPLRDDQRFVLATNSYRTAECAGFADSGRGQIVLEDRRPLRRVLESYLCAQKSVSPQPKSGWTFAPLPGTTVTFDSSSRAVDHLDGTELTVIGPQTSGFMRFRLAL